MARELAYRRTTHSIAAALLLCVPLTAMAEPGAYPQTEQTTAELAEWIEPNGWQEPVVAASAIDKPFESVPPPPGESGATFPLEPHAYETNGVGGEGGVYVNGAYVDGTVMGTPYDRVCAPHDPLQPRCRYTDDFMWGCGGSPFRNGPGTCDTWRVGCRWDTSVDGMVLWRERIDLDRLEDAANNPAPSDIRTQFGYGGGARLYAMGKVPRWPGYQIQFGYEGIEEWNAALLFPEFDPPNENDLVSATRSVHYRSSFHSAEFNFYHRPPRRLRPFWGIRYVRFVDEIQDSIDEFGPPPNSPDFPVMDSIVTEDSLEFIDIKNNLIGFQVGGRHDMWQVSRRVSVQGFFNAGVYYNRIQFSQGEVRATTEQTVDDPMTLDVDEGIPQTITSGSFRSTEPTDIAYLAEASISTVCKLNRCCAIRCGYQALWIDGLHLAEDVYVNEGLGLSMPLGRHDFFLHGWHVGLEYRR